MGRPKKKLLYPTLSFQNYQKLVRFSLTHPFLYIDSLSESPNITLSLKFFIVNIALGTFLKVILVLLLTQNITAVFLGISSLIFFLPISLALFLFSALILFLIAKALGGRGSFGRTLSICSYALIPTILFQLPILSILGLLYSIFLLTLSFKRVQGYSWSRAVFTVVLPFIVLITLLVSIGILNPFYLFSLNII